VPCRSGKSTLAAIPAVDTGLLKIFRYQEELGYSLKVGQDQERTKDQIGIISGKPKRKNAAVEKMPRIIASTRK